jgi:hypothetical protein
MQTFTVIKTVEYHYTIEAESIEEAERLASDFGTIEANQWTTLDVAAESNEEYEQSIEG